MAGVVIIGSGLAGYHTAKEFRRLDAQTPLTLLTASEGHFYSKPQLSTALTMGKDAETLVTQACALMAAQLNADIQSGVTVKQIDPKAQKIYFNNDVMGYDQLVLALGARPLMAPVQGDAAGDVLSVNQLEDYRFFRDQLGPIKKIIIMGAGLVACEFANDLANSGYQVSLVAPAVVPLDGLLPEALGETLKTAMTERLGIEWHLQDIAKEVMKKKSGYEVVLHSGAILEGDLVLSAIGLEPNIDLAREAGLKLDRGIIVDGCLRTSDPHIYAIGDCAEVLGELRFYVKPLLVCAKVLAQVLVGQTASVQYPLMPVGVKTACCPVNVLLPPRQCKGHWDCVSGSKAVFYDAIGQIRGFALVDESVKERAELLKSMQP